MATKTEVEAEAMPEGDEERELEKRLEAAAEVLRKEPCAVCLDVLASGECMGALECKHYYCFDCIYTVGNKRQTPEEAPCPVCRAPFAFVIKYNPSTPGAAAVPMPLKEVERRQPEEGERPRVPEVLRMMHDLFNQLRHAGHDEPTSRAIAVQIIGHNLHNAYRNDVAQQEAEDDGGFAPVPIHVWPELSDDEGEDDRFEDGRVLHAAHFNGPGARSVSIHSSRPFNPFGITGVDDQDSDDDYEDSDEDDEPDESDMYYIPPSTGVAVRRPAAPDTRSASAAARLGVQPGSGVTRRRRTRRRR